MKELTLEERLREILKENLPEESREEVEKLLKLLLAEFERELLNRSIPLVERIARKIK